MYFLERIAILLAAIAPMAIFLVYGFLRTRTATDNEAIWEALALGALAALGASFVELGVGKYLLPDMGTVGGAAIRAIFVGLCEESAKFALIMLIAVKHADVRRPPEIVLVAMAVAMGFAGLENFWYVVGEESWSLVAYARALTAVPSHGLDGLLMGAFIMLAHLNAAKRTRYLVLALVLPAILHTIYDFHIFWIKEGSSELKPIISVSWWLFVVVSSIVEIVVASRILCRVDKENLDLLRRPVSIYAILMLPTLLLLMIGLQLIAGEIPRAAFAAMLSPIPLALAIDLYVDRRRVINSSRSPEGKIPAD